MSLSLCRSQSVTLCGGRRAERLPAEAINFFWWTHCRQEPEVGRHLGLRMRILDLDGGAVCDCVCSEAIFLS